MAATESGSGIQGGSWGDFVGVICKLALSSSHVKISKRGDDPEALVISENFALTVENGQPPLFQSGISEV